VGLQCWSLMDVDIRECLTACPTSAASLSPASFRFALALRLCFNSIGLHRGTLTPKLPDMSDTQARAARRSSVGFPRRTSKAWFGDLFDELVSTRH